MIEEPACRSKSPLTENARTKERVAALAVCVMDEPASIVRLAKALVEAEFITSVAFF